jgi:uncharacterized protein (DUF2126 family)
MGEEGSSGGTVRYVDSSLERIEVKVSGLVDPRHVLTCNGVPVPCSPPAAPASSWPACATAPGCRRARCTRPSASTRRSPSTWSTPGCSAAWAAASTTSPTRAAATTRPSRSTPFEAESRRLARFFTIGHTPGKMVVGKPQRSQEFPFTLDLRTA